MALMDIPHVVDAQSEMKIKPDGTWEFVMHVYTDLELDVLHPKHQKAEVDDLLVALQNHVKAHPHHVHMHLYTRQSPDYGAVGRR